MSFANGHPGDRRVAPTSFPTSPFIELRGIRIRFPGVLALDEVSLEIHRREVVGLCGENGAGKSTLSSILAGQQGQYEGEILVEGHPLELTTPSRSRDVGIALVEQELSLVPELSVAENICLGAPPTRGNSGVVSWRRVEKHAQAVLESIGVELPVRTPVKDLSPAHAQLVEIAKGVAKQPRLLILDEPTSSLTPAETEKVLELVRKLKSSDCSIIYISHKLDEVLAIADSIVVLRDGRKVGAGPRRDWTEERLIKAMVGRDLSQLYKRQQHEAGEVGLEIRSLSCRGHFEAASLQVRRGEIVGMSGLVGAGRSELAETVFGLRKATSGEIIVHGKKLEAKSPRGALASGIALVPEDRRRDGIIPDLTSSQNVALASLGKYCRGLIVNPKKENQAVDAVSRKVELNREFLPRRISTLSGGNKQKCVIAKMLLLSPTVLILDEPTRGIDVGAKAEIYRIVSELVRSGVACLLISSDMPELLAMCDRIFAMYRGHIVAEFSRDSATEEALMAAVSGSQFPGKEILE